jgi:hypothetical protein
MSETPKEVPASEIIQELIGQGYRVTRIFQPEQNADFEAYIADLKAKGIDYKFVIDTDLEGTHDSSTGKTRSREIKVLEK